MDDEDGRGSGYWRNARRSAVLPTVRGDAAASDAVGGRRRFLRLVSLRIKGPRTMEAILTSWFTLAGFGAFHGLNPGMGWLFAVALGMQEGKRSAVWRALIPLTLGHALAIAAAIAVAMAAGTAL